MTIAAIAARWHGVAHTGDFVKMLIREEKGFYIPKKYLFNAGVALFGIATVALASRELFIPKTVPGCDMRYAKAGLFAWQRGDGSLLSPVDLQAKLSGYDWGVLENVRFVKVPDQPFGSAMEVSMPQENAKARTPRKPSGAGFVWAPSWLKEAHSACLSYSVKLPEDFKFGAGGSLPGLFGGNPDAADRVADKRSDTFSTRLHWRENAMIEMRVKSTEIPTGANFGLDKNYLRLDAGAWVNIEQEVVLNSPGQADGILRVWVDGDLKIDRKDMSYRGKPNEGFQGVLANIHYATRELEWSPSPKSTAIQFSPFYVRWQ